MDFREKMMEHEVICDAIEKINSKPLGHQHEFFGYGVSFSDTVSYNATKKIERLREASWLSDDAYNKLKNDL